MFDSEPGRFRAWRARRKAKNSQLTAWLASMFVVVVLGGGILVVLLPGDWFSSSDTPAEVEVEIPSKVIGPAPEEIPICQPKEPLEGSLDTAPDTTWVLVGKSVAPENPDVGPQLLNDVRQCYARSPEGALFAAANYFAVLVNSTPEERVKLMEARMSRDGDYAARLAVMKDVAATEPDNELPKQTIVGYRWVSYDGDSATLQLVPMTQQGTMYSIVYTLRWQDNDWKLLAAPLSGPASQTVESLVNYIPWSGTT